MRGLSTSTPLLTASLLIALAFGAAACGGGGETVDPVTTYGYRYAEGPEGRRTLDLVPPAPEEEYFVYPAVVTDVTARSGPTLPDGRRPVEIVFEGAFPDACMVLHDIREERLGQFIILTFEARRPKGAICPTVVRAYRFYYELAEPLPVGAYTLRINGDVHPFEVLPERSPSR